MNVSAAPVTPATSIMAPALQAMTEYRNDLLALGATSVTAPGALEVRSSFADVPRGVTAANLVNDTIYGARMVFDMPATGIPFMTSSWDFAQALRSLPGVQFVQDGMMTDRPVIDVVAQSAHHAQHLDTLLRDSVQVLGRGGMQQVAINIEYGPKVVPFGANA